MTRKTKLKNHHEFDSLGPRRVEVALFQHFQCQLCHRKRTLAATDIPIFGGVQCEQCGNKMANVTKLERRVTDKLLLRLDEFRRRA